MGQRQRRIFILESEQRLPCGREEVFRFFSDPSNLGRLTPPWLHFQVLTPPPIRMQNGTRIDYRLRIHRIPIRWQSEITSWDPPRRFVDEQRRGPYRLWIHEHTFEEAEGATICRDRVEYAVPGGRLVQRFFVGPDLSRIFAFRRAELSRIFATEK